MMIAWAVAAALAHEGAPEIFGEAQGWSIARHAGGCMMTREFGGEGNTILTFLIDPTEVGAPLTVLVGNSRWVLSEAEVDGYSIEFGGSDAVWADLAARTFSTGEADGDRDGIISMGFADDAISPMMTDLAEATGFHLLRQGVTVDRVSFSGTSEAVRTLGECLAALP